MHNGTFYYKDSNQLFSFSQMLWAFDNSWVNDQFRKTIKILKSTMLAQWKGLNHGAQKLCTLKWSQQPNTCLVPWYFAQNLALEHEEILLLLWIWMSMVHPMQRLRHSIHTKCRLQAHFKGPSIDWIGKQEHKPHIQVNKNAGKSSGWAK